MNTPNPVLPAVRELAQLFSNFVQGALTKKQFAKVVLLNQQETDPNVCHTHDFVDANEVMASAWLELTGREISLDRVNSNNVQDAVNIWNAAWSAAKAAGFNPSNSTTLV